MNQLPNLDEHPAIIDLRQRAGELTSRRNQLRQQLDDLEGESTAGGLDPEVAELLGDDDAAELARAAQAREQEIASVRRCLVAHDAAVTEVNKRLQQEIKTQREAITPAIREQYGHLLSVIAKALTDLQQAFAAEDAFCRIDIGCGLKTAQVIKRCQAPHGLLAPSARDHRLQVVKGTDLWRERARDNGYDL